MAAAVKSPSMVQLLLIIFFFFFFMLTFSAVTSEARSRRELTAVRRIRSELNDRSKQMKIKTASKKSGGQRGSDDFFTLNRLSPGFRVTAVRGKRFVSGGIQFGFRGDN
ncbi:hypothetical protein LINPERPRIM_LOCUS43984 [Linum perenne]